MAVTATLAAKGACFGFSEVETSSEHEKAISWGWESQVPQGQNQIKI